MFPSKFSNFYCKFLVSFFSSFCFFYIAFGKNGAGKTNFVRAVATLRNFVLAGRLPQRAAELWCKIDDKNEGWPTDFEIAFIADKNLYEYRISLVLATGIITKEELVHVVGNRHTKLFYKDPPPKPLRFSPFNKRAKQGH